MPPAENFTHTEIETRSRERVRARSPSCKRSVTWCLVSGSGVAERGLWRLLSSYWLVAAVSCVLGRSGCPRRACAVFGSARGRRSRCVCRRSSSNGDAARRNARRRHDDGDSRAGRTTWRPTRLSCSTSSKKGVRLDVKPVGRVDRVQLRRAWCSAPRFSACLRFTLYPRVVGTHSRAREQDARGRSGSRTVTFDDVAGVDEAKDEVKEIVDFLREPGRFSAIGGRIPKGVLLVGPPGTGKTLLARSIAGEAGVPFLFASGSDFVEMYAGVGASRIRQLFKDARRHPSCIVFIDELDAVGRSRGGQSLSHEEREQTLNQLLVEMDGFAPNQGIVVVAATNRPDILDPALLRPGRFDRQVTVGAPDMKGREQILRIHAKKVALDPRRRPASDRARHARVFRRRAREPDQRSGAVRRPRRRPPSSARRPRRGARQGADGRRAPVAVDDRARARDVRVPRIRPRRRGGAAAGRRSAAQGDDHPARPRARRHDAAAGRRSAHAHARIPRGADRDPDGRPHRRGAVSPADDERRRQRHRARHRASRRRMVCEFGMSTLGPLAYRAPGNPRDDRSRRRDQRGDRRARRRGSARARDARLRNGAAGRSPRIARRSARWPRSCWWSSRSTPRPSRRLSPGPPGLSLSPHDGRAGPAGLQTAEI